MGELVTGTGIDRAAAAELDRVRRDYCTLIEHASASQLRAPSDGTRWTNRQLLFHMLLGYLITRALLALATVFSVLPAAPGRAFARLLDALRAPFHLVNYLGSCAGALIVPLNRMPARLDKITARLQERVDRETPASLAQGMRYPVTWDPYFTSRMTRADIYRYPTRHYNHHRRQLTLPQARLTPQP
jgi:uncharacterized damage-inducible protein DinB